MPDITYLDPYLYKIGNRDTTLLGGSMQPPLKKLVSCHKRFEKAMREVVRYLTCNKAVQKELSAEANNRNAREAKNNWKALFSKESLERAIASIETGRTIATEVGWELGEEADGGEGEGEGEGG